LYRHVVIPLVLVWLTIFSILPIAWIRLKTSCGLFNRWTWSSTGKALILCLVPQKLSTYMWSKSERNLHDISNSTRVIWVGSQRWCQQVAKVTIDDDEIPKVITCYLHTNTLKCLYLVVNDLVRFT
jgi:hypothetical protein